MVGSELKNDEVCEFDATQSPSPHGRVGTRKGARRFAEGVRRRPLMVGSEQH